MKKQKNKKQQFNFYWVYAAIAAFFILLQLFNVVSNPIQKITKQKFLTDFISENEVEKVIIVNNEFVEVFIKELKLEKEKHVKSDAEKKELNVKNNNRKLN